MNKKGFNEKKYKEDLKKYRESLASSALAADRALHILMLMSFYEIGEDIRKKGNCVDEYIERVSKDFQDYTLIMTKQNIKSMCKFSSLIKIEEIISLCLFNYYWSELLPYINDSSNHDEFVAYIESDKKIGKA